MLRLQTPGCRGAGWRRVDGDGSFRSREGEAIKVAERFQGGGHANAAGAVMPKSIRQVPDAVEYIRQILTPKTDAPLNSLENLFAGIEAQKR